MGLRTEIDEQFRHYRQSGVAYSLSLISLSSGLVIWTNALLTRTSPHLVGWLRCLSMAVMVAAALTITSALLIQLFHYIGYRHFARSLYGQADRAASVPWFDREDIAVYVASGLFLLCVIGAVWLFILLQ